MIIENINLTDYPQHYKVTRVCDECGKKEEAKIKIVLRGREVRLANIDLCKHCSNIGKYRKIPTGVKNGHWKHGISVQGYKRVHVNDERLRVLEHVLVMEKSLNRRMNRGERIHHIDGDKLNNNIDNLCLFPNNSEHRFCHASFRSCGYKLLGQHIFFDPDSKQYVMHPCRKYGGLVLSADDREVLTKMNTVIQKPRKRNIEVECVCLYDPNTKKQKYKKYHVLMAEKSLKRRLFHGEHVHHINGNAIDNRAENLIVMNESDHSMAHFSMDDCCYILYKQGLISFNRELKVYSIRK